MVRNRKWAGWLLAIIALAVLIPLTIRFVQQAAPNKQQPRTAAVEQERHLKAASVKRDINATALLCTMECSRDFRKMLESRRQSGNKEKFDSHLAEMMRLHPHMQAVVYVSKSNRTAKGTIPEGMDKKAGQQLQAAEKAVAAGKEYHSPLLIHGGHRYMVLGIPGHKGSGEGMAGLIKQDILSEVERHQQRNLRLVPYPPEGRYRTESAEPGTLKETTVRSGEDNGNASHYHINEVVVRFRQIPGDQMVKKIGKDIDAVSMRKLGYTYVFRSKEMDAKRMMRYFTNKWNPVYVEPHYLYLTNTIKPNAASSDLPLEPIVPNDALYAQYQWNLPSIETEKGWNVSKGDEQVIVAIVDTGVQLTHPDLQGKLVEGINIVDKNNPPEDDVGHGTHVAGIIAASVNNGEGIAGISWFNKVMPVKALDSSGAGSTYSVAEGIIWATDHGAKVINMSLGNYASAQFLHDAIKYAYDHDVVLVAASGNDNTDRPGFPAAYPEVFAVAATNADSERASFSNYGDYIDVAAPGETIPSTYPGNQYAALSGTSMASPHVAALAALIRSKNPYLTNEDVMSIMRSTALDLGVEGKDDDFGYGQIDVVRALEAADQSVASLGQFNERLSRRLASIASR